jgi:hypothetical protein
MTVEEAILVNVFVTRVVERPREYPDYESVYADVEKQCTKISRLLTAPNYIAIATRVWEFVSKNPGCYTLPKNT